MRLAATILLLAAVSAAPCRAGRAPQNVPELWADFDPRAEPLDVRVAHAWADDTGAYEVLRYRIATFKGTDAWMAAFYGRPKVDGKVPGLLHLHGGGQRAFLDVVRYYVGRGYACLSVNWGGLPLDDRHPEWPTTDWGAVDPTQTNVPGYFSLKPTPKSLLETASPKNNNWYLLTLAARRGLTLLERRPEVDAARLGVFGHSMGGRLAFMVAGTDDRVKAAVPSVGGAGFETRDPAGLSGIARRIDASDDAARLFDRTLDAAAYAPQVRCPILFLGATNDFNSRTERVYDCYARLPHPEYRVALTPHMNHRFAAEQEVCRPLWLDAHLKGAPRFPKTPQADLVLDAPDHVPRVRVRPDASQPVAGVDIYYAIDPDAVARFWRDAGARRDGDVWVGRCPLMDLDRPLVALANVFYDAADPIAPPHGRPVGRFALTSNLVRAAPAELKAAGARATDAADLVIDDFSRPWHDWYRLSPDNPQHWQFWTRKVTDPKWRGPAGADLAVTLRAERANTLVVTMLENEWRGYRGRKREYAAEVTLAGGETPQQVRLAPGDFKDTRDGTPLAGWAEVDQLGLRAWTAVERDGKAARLGGAWDGPPPEIREVRWMPR